MGKKEVLPLVTIWMGLEGIMLSEISQRKTNIVCYHLHVESKKAELIGTESRIVVTRGRRVGEKERCQSKDIYVQL